MNIEAVVFDLGRVLIDVDFSGIFSRYLDPAKHNSFSLDLETIMKNPWFQDLSTGKTTIEKFHKKISEHFGINIDLENFINEWCSIFKPMPGMQELVLQTAKKMPVGLLSDTDPVHWEFLLGNYPFLKTFNDPVLSFKTGILKPAKICYIKAGQSVNTALEKCLFIDDRTVNVNGAQQAGMQSIHFESYAKLVSYFKEARIIN